MRKSIRLVIATPRPSHDPGRSANNAARRERLRANCEHVARQSRTMSTPRTLYAAKCYWPGVTERTLEQAAARAAAEADATSRTGSAVGYFGSILFQDDELVLCLFDAPSRAAVRRTTERAAIPCERVMASLWLPHAREPEPRQDGSRSRTDENHPHTEVSAP
jgi:hypothetical protein